MMVCASCKSEGNLYLFDKRCFMCYEENPYYEKYWKKLSKQHWFCENEDCESLNLLPSTECRNCFVESEGANSQLKDLKLDYLVKQRMSKQLMNFASSFVEKEHQEKRQKRLQRLGTAPKQETHWRCSDPNCLRLHEDDEREEMWGIVHRHPPVRRLDLLASEKNKV
uniref:RanBP2-type domain-containing protein n=1 Tax=Strombidium rassoulzadegani TaxID=1082188 RepID=A0A7S3FVU8_9SPIT|mmetsp:Transcript_16885/g.28604  ORF Transcript_16885/g.28604 Transcript_16885/m.28604 type:complete len:167 (+) Transcript_16885:740-1240(+)